MRNAVPKKTYPPRDAARPPSHPGAVLREIVLPELGLSKIEIARALQISRNQLHLILSEKQPVTPQTAVKLEAALGGSAKLWLNMQSAYDLWHAQRSVDLRKVRPLRAA